MMMPTTDWLASNLLSTFHVAPRIAQHELGAVVARNVQRVPLSRLTF
jgi:hypothetical protein